MSDTPKTDAKELVYGDLAVVPADFARKQERAIAELVAALNKAEGFIVMMSDPASPGDIEAQAVRNALAKQGETVTDTPRTDAAEYIIYESVGRPAHVVSSDLARDLESEVTRLRKSLEDIARSGSLMVARRIALYALHRPCTDAGCERCCG